MTKLLILIASVASAGLGAIGLVLIAYAVVDLLGYPDNPKLALVRIAFVCAALAVVAFASTVLYIRYDNQEVR